MSARTITMAAIASGEVPAELTGVRWADGTVECRFRVLHPAGSLVAVDGALGEILIDPAASCDRCSDACG